MDDEPLAAHGSYSLKTITNHQKIWSTATVKAPSNTIEMPTTTVEPFNSVQVGQLHLRSSSLVCWTYAAKRAKWPPRQSQAKAAPMTTAQTIIQTKSCISQTWRRGRDSNPRRR